MIALFSRCFIKVVKNQCMQAKNCFECDRSRLFNQTTHFIIGVRVIGGFQVLSETMTPNSYSFFDNHLCLTQAQRIPLDRIAVIGEADAQVFMQSAGNSWSQRPMQIQLGLFLLQTALQAGIKLNIFLLARSLSMIWRHYGSPFMISDYNLLKIVKKRLFNKL